MRQEDGVEQTAAAHGGEQRVAGCHDALAQLLAALFGVLDQMLVLDGVQRGESRRRAQGVAREGGAVGSRREQRGQFASE